MLLEIWHEFCLSLMVHPLQAKADSVLFFSTFATSIVAYDEQDYDAFAYLLLRE